MNSKRRAELQRRLTLNVVPRPPADLGERIKNDIPRYLQAHEPAARRSIGFGLRIAASVIVLLGSVIGAVVLLTPPTEKGMREAPVPSVVPSTVTRQTADAATESAAPAEIRLEMSDESPASAEEIPPQIARLEVSAAPPAAVRQAGNSIYAPEADTETRAQSGVIAGAASGADTVDASRPAEDFRAEPAPSLAAATEALAAPPPPPAAARAEAAPAKAAQHAAAERTPVVTYARELSLGPAPSAFGASLDRTAFDRIRASIESGSRPAPEMVDVEALVNYFAGAPARPPRQGLRLEVEASPAPVVSRGDRAILRVTIDAPRAGTAGGTSVPPAATHAEIEVSIDSKAVASFRPIGDGAPLTRESVVHRNTSVTILYELELKPNLRAHQRVAHVRLAYTSAEGGGRESVERQINGRDLAREWPRSTARHRLASLGAVWGETLKGTEGGLDVARRAEELAADTPGNPRAKELARLASAVSRLRSAGP